MVSFRNWMLGVPGGVKIVKGIWLYTIHNQYAQTRRRFKTPTNQIELEGNRCDRLRGMREKKRGQA
jgi:hypothetical protein